MNEVRCGSYWILVPALPLVVGGIVVAAALAIADLLPGGSK